MLAIVENWWEIVAVCLGLKSNVVLVYENGFELSYSKGKLWDHVRVATAIRAGIDVQPLNKDKMVFTLTEVTFQEELNELGFSFLYFATKLFLAGAKFIDSKTLILPNSVKLKFSNKDLSHLFHIYETFFEESYGLLDVKGKIVVDVGANIGDTSLYFASKGALKVYSFEPEAETFSYLLDNIKLNNMGDVIQPLNNAVASKQGKIQFMSAENFSGKSRVNEEKNTSCYWVNAETLPLDADILKMDCEGCEYDVLLNLGSGKLKFKEILLEFHHGFKVLKDFLEREGYVVKITKKPVKEGTLMIGMLYARLDKIAQKE
jgi:FkbM family methyltransferase